MQSSVAEVRIVDDLKLLDHIRLHLGYATSGSCDMRYEARARQAMQNSQRYTEGVGRRLMVLYPTYIGVTKTGTENICC